MSKITERFPFRYITKGYLGSIWRPYALCEFKNIKEDLWIPMELVIDTGADYTLLPLNYAYLLGINLDNDCYKETTLGIGGEEKVYLYKKLQAKIGRMKINIPVGFLKRNDVPPLLGRLKFLELLRITFNKHVTLFEC